MADGCVRESVGVPEIFGSDMKGVVMCAVQVYSFNMNGPPRSTTNEASIPSGSLSS